MQNKGLKIFLDSLRELVISNKAIIVELEEGLRRGRGQVFASVQKNHVNKTLTDLKEFTNQVEFLEKQIRNFEAN